MKKYLGVLSPAALAVFCFILGGCARTRPARFYRLQPMAEPAASTSDDPMHVAIGPVELPPHLDRPQLAVRRGPYEILYDEYNRWAGDLRENALNVLAGNLSSLLGPADAVAVPWTGASTPDYRLMVRFEVLDGEIGGEAEVRALWVLIVGELGEEVAVHSFHAREIVDGEGAEALVAAQSRLLLALSRDIADALRNHMKTTPAQEEEEQVSQ